MTKVYRWPQGLPSLEGKSGSQPKPRNILTLIVTQTRGPRHFHPGPVESPTAWQFSVGTLWSLSTFPSLLCAPGADLYELQHLGSFALFPFGFDQWERMKDYLEDGVGIFCSPPTPTLLCSVSVSAWCDDSGLIPLWLQLLWVACLPHSSPHRALIMLFPQSAFLGLEMRMGMDHEELTLNTVIFLFIIQVKQGLRCESLTIMLDMVSMGTDALHLKPPPLQLSF